MKKIFKKIINILEKLSSKPKIGALEITDSTLRYLLLFDKPRAFSLRLPPGVIQEGKILDPQRFLAYLNQFHNSIEPKKKINLSVVVILSSSLIYTQEFHLPAISRDKIKEAAELNLQMISPMSKDNAYMGWQIIEETQDHYELLGAFAEKGTVNQYNQILDKAGFSPIAFEFTALALTRSVNKVLKPTVYPILFVQISSEGFNLFIIRNQSLCFDYFRSWYSVQGDNRQISKELFEETISQEVQKVMNFAMGRFKEAPAEIYLIAPGFEKKTQDLLMNRFGIKTTPFIIQPSLSPNWSAVFGSALRGIMERNKDDFISLGPLKPAELFYQEQILNFAALWRNIIIGVTSFFLISFASSIYFLNGEYQKSKDRLELFQAVAPQSELTELENSVVQFNNLIKEINEEKKDVQPWGLFFGRLEKLADDNGIILERLELYSLKDAINLTARASDYQAVIRFKNILSAEPGFSNIDVPMAKITSLENNTVGFTIVFKFTETTTQ